MNLPKHAITLSPSKRVNRFISFDKLRMISLVGLLLGVGLVWAADPQDLQEGLQRKLVVAIERGSIGKVIEVRRELGDVLLASGQYGQGARQYELALALQPSRKHRLPLHLSAGRAFEKMGEMDKAIRHFEAALAENKNHLEALYLLARAYAQVDLNEEAEQRYQRLIRLSPHRFEAHYELGTVYQRRGLLGRAIESYRHALAIEKRPEAYLAIADAYARQDESDRAIETLTQAQALGPQVDYDERLGHLYRHRGEWEKAAASWETVLRTSPERAEVMLNLALLYARMGKAAEGQKLFETLRLRYPRSPLVQVLRAWTLYQQGNREGAREAGLHAKALTPTPFVQLVSEKLLELCR